MSISQLFERFPDSETARIYLEKRRWPDGPVCPHCGEDKRIYERGNGYYKCNADLRVFTVRTGTIFERSKVGLHKWVYAMYLFDHGISSAQLSKQIGVTQKTAWLMLQRLREGCADDPSQNSVHLLLISASLLASSANSTSAEQTDTCKVEGNHPAA